MSFTIDLPDELADALAKEADRLGLSLPEYAARLLAASRRSTSSIPSGAELVSYWRAEGVIGSRPDLDDSQAEARRLREHAQRRGA